jgi:uncharacterized YkwD family protein
LVLTGLTTVAIGAAWSLPAFAATPVVTYTINGVKVTTSGTTVVSSSPTKITWVINGQTITTPTSTPAPAPKPTPSPTPAPAPTPAPVTNPTTLPAGLTVEEQQMITLVNQERVKAGVKPLQVDMRLVKVGRMKSQDMINNHYFDHMSPTYGSPFDLMKAQGITFRTAGENIAGNWTVQAAHTALMNSPGHRSNILSPNYTSIGIGIIKGGPYGLMISQEFIG